MISFSSKVEIYEWFKDLQAWNRMDFICNLIHLCHPFELRFIGSCIEYMAQTDYNTLKDYESKANSLESLEQFINKQPPVNEFQSHITLYIALLQSSNYKVAAKLGDFLEEKLEGLNLQHLMEAHLKTELEQWMLMLTLAAYHPAFSFEKQLNFRKKLSDYERMNKNVRKNCRGHHFNPNQRTSSKYQDCDETVWRTDVNTEVVPYPRYPVCHQRGYWATYPVKPQGNAHDGYDMPQSLRPSALPTALVSPSAIGDSSFIDNFHPVNCLPNPEYQLFNSQQQEKSNSKSFHPSEDRESSSRTIWSNSVYGSRLPSNNPVPATEADIQSSAPSFQPTVSQPPTLASVTSVISTVVSTEVFTSGSTESTKSSDLSHTSECLTSSSANPSAFVAVSTSGSAEAALRRSCYELNHIEGLKTRNRSQSGDMSSNHQRNGKSSANNIHFLDGPPAPLRSSTSAPLLTTSLGNFIGQQSTKVKTNRGNKNTDTSPSIPPHKQNTRPVQVFVSQTPKKEEIKLKGGLCFRLEINWSDGTTSECDRNVVEIMKFYKTINEKLGKNAPNIDYLAKQSNQTLERSKKLGNTILSTTVNEVTEEDFLEFFKHNSPPPYALPPKKRKYKLGTKSRVVVDGSSSSSSTASPPLINNARTRIPKQSDSRQESSLSPPPVTKSATSNSSAVSSPNSNASSGSHVEEDTNFRESETRNDPFLKLYHWLKDHNLSNLYTHLKEFTFDQFCKLEAADIDSIAALSPQECTKIKEAMEKMTKDIAYDRDAVDIDLGTLSVSSKDTSSDAFSDSSKTMDIKAILDDVTRQSEDEKSVSSQSVPVAFAHCPEIDTVASSSCFSFEFEGTDTASMESSNKISLRNMNQCHANYECPNDERTLMEPGRAMSQGDMGYMEDNTPPSLVHPYFPPQSAPPVQHIRYCNRTYGSEMAMPATYGWYPYTYNSSFLPRTVSVCSNRSTVSATSQMSSREPTATIPSPIHVPVSKPMQYVYTIATTIPAQYIHNHSTTTAACDSAPLPGAGNPAEVMSPAPGSEASYLSQQSTNPDADSRSSPTSSDPDSTSRPSEDPNQNSLNPETALPAVPVPAPANYYYAVPPPYFHMNPHHSAIVRPSHQLSPTFSDPTPYPPKNRPCNNFMELKYKRNNSQNYSNTPNGYVDSGHHNMKSHPHKNKRISNHRHLSGDTYKWRDTSCYNCGLKGHSASSCRDPNVAEVLGSDFQLRLSQSNSKRINN